MNADMAEKKSIEIVYNEVLVDRLLRSNVKH